MVSNKSSGMGIVHYLTSKNKSELRMEINLPSSGLAKVALSDFFPSPPSDHQKSQVFDSLASPLSEASHTEVERIWSYYLSEIAVRKIGNRVMNCFYQEDAAAWLSMPLHRLIRVAEELELQLSQWYVWMIAPLRILFLFLNQLFLSTD